MNVDANECPCLALGPMPGSFDETSVGQDPTDGRYADVSIRACRLCGRLWLHYFVEHEAFTGSSRWYTGLLPAGAETGLTPERAVPLLESLPWHVHGGSYFGHAGRRVSRAGEQRAPGSHPSPWPLVF